MQIVTKSLKTAPSGATPIVIKVNGQHELINKTSVHCAKLALHKNIWHKKMYVQVQ